MVRHKTRPVMVPMLVALMGLAGARGAWAQRERISIPAETIVRVRLDGSLSSRDARVGDRVAATISPDDRSGFPLDTRFEGTVTEVQRSTEDQPGIIDTQFRRALLPDGTRIAVDGRLAALSGEDVRRTGDGRIESRRRGGKFDPKWVGYGAGAGAVLATIFGGGFLKGALLGGLGGAVYAYINKDKGRDRDRGRFKEVVLDRGTEFGIRLNDRVAFDPRDDYRFRRAERDDRPENDRVLGEREEFRYGTTAVRVDGRLVEFGEARPLNLNGVLFLPLAPIAEAARMRFTHRLGEDSFTIATPEGPVRAFTGETEFTGRGDRAERLDTAPIAVNGEVYVPTEFLSRAAGLEVNWDPRALRLELESRR